MIKIKNNILNFNLNFNKTKDYPYYMQGIRLSCCPHLTKKKFPCKNFPYNKLNSVFCYVHHIYNHKKTAINSESNSKYCNAVIKKNKIISLCRNRRKLNSPYCGLHSHFLLNHLFIWFKKLKILTLVSPMVIFKDYLFWAIMGSTNNDVKCYLTTIFNKLTRVLNHETRLQDGIMYLEEISINHLISHRGRFYYPNDSIIGLPNWVLNIILPDHRLVLYSYSKLFILIKALIENDVLVFDEDETNPLGNVIKTPTPPNILAGSLKFSLPTCRLLWRNAKFYPPKEVFLETFLENMNWSLLSEEIQSKIFALFPEVFVTNSLSLDTVINFLFDRGVYALIFFKKISAIFWYRLLQLAREIQKIRDHCWYVGLEGKQPAPIIQNLMQTNRNFFESKNLFLKKMIFLNELVYELWYDFYLEHLNVDWFEFIGVGRLIYNIKDCKDEFRRERILDFFMTLPVVKFNSSVNLNNFLLNNYRLPNLKKIDNNEVGFYSMPADFQYQWVYSLFITWKKFKLNFFLSLTPSSILLKYLVLSQVQIKAEPTIDLKKNFDSYKYFVEKNVMWITKLKEVILHKNKKLKKLSPIEKKKHFQYMSTQIEHASIKKKKSKKKKSKKKI